MTLSVELPDEVVAAIKADAVSQGKSPATVVAERIAALYADLEPEAVQAIAQGLADLEAGDTGMLLEDFIAERRRNKTVGQSLRADA